MHTQNNYKAYAIHTDADDDGEIYSFFSRLGFDGVPALPSFNTQIDPDNMECIPYTYMVAMGSVKCNYLFDL